ncbi:hypothetical protein [Frigoribacterium sp. 9N]|uniref:hypothetical protein n=1 Tax=Frigoribacterium sp. 9N TaxID=2653144 RepID=UPI0012F0081F|nr:hypothetical protein [Frigoribacterium sp. 9N]VXB71955.1 conserved hypothetical protein [Frigoribacterium sp. 9N]
MADSRHNGQELFSAYLLNRNWEKRHDGRRASVWARGVVEIGLPDALNVGSFEWTDVVRRVAAAEGRTESALETDLEFSGYDGVRFRIANENFIGRTVPLHSGHSLVNSAYAMLRASATTAQRPRSQIGKHYSKIGDEYLERARLGHTEEGSFILPVLFRHDDSELPTGQDTIAGIEHVAHESPQRRIVRTLAESLQAYRVRVIEPAKEVRQRDLLPVIAAGGSREMFSGLEKILYDPAVAEFDTGFTWGLTLPAARTAPSKVSIPVEARELVKQTVELLTVAEKSPLRVITGPIVSIAHEPGSPLGQIAIQAPNANGRPSRYFVNVRRRQLESLHAWMSGSITVVVQGVIEHLPGRPLQLADVLEPKRLDEAFLSSTDEQDGAATPA